MRRDATMTATRRIGFRAMFEKLEEARAMFPRCVCCGRDLSAERLMTLVYLPDRNRFACETCPTMEGPHAA